MSKILYVIFKDESICEETRNKVRVICDNLNPDNIKAHPTKIVSNDKIIAGISNPVKKLETYRASILFGQIFGVTENWNQIGGQTPDGNYAIFRETDKKVEVISDILGTRSVWYYKNDNLFIASTSQRAIVQYLGDFYFNEQVIPWFLSNGLLGPGLSWDRRISLLPPDSSLVLDRSSWSFKIKTEEIKFIPNNDTDKININNLHHCIKSTFSTLALDYKQWKLTLSGGYDSRGNFCFLPKRDKSNVGLHTLTWGTRESENVKGSDAEIAKKIAQKFKTEHHYFPTNKKEEPLEIVLERFLKNGEGRIDHIGGYTDGFKIWKILFENSVTGTIRGDEVFGSYDFISEFHMMKFIGLSVCSDYENLSKHQFIKSFNQKIPEKYKRKNRESREEWRDRLYQSYLVPIFLSALADLKEPYVEQVNPFLSRRIIHQIREMPDHLRTDKKAFKEIVKTLIPNIPFAKRASTISTDDLFSKEEMVLILQKELNSNFAKKIFPDNFLSWVNSEIQFNNNTKKKWGQALLSNIKTLVPKNIKRGILKQTHTTPRMNMNVLAFRVFIIVRIFRLLTEDVKKNS